MRERRSSIWRPRAAHLWKRVSRCSARPITRSTRCLVLLGGVAATSPSPKPLAKRPMCKLGKRVSYLLDDLLALIDGWEKLRKLKEFMGDMENSIKT